MGNGIRFALTLLGCFGGAALVTRLLAQLERDFCLAPLSVFTAVHMSFLILSPELYDRYLIVFFPWSLALAGRTLTARPRWIGAVAALAAFGLVSVGLMHDWLAWNSARWEVGRRALVDRGIKALDIEGGFEWDGWHASAPISLDEAYLPPSGFMLPFNRKRHPDFTGRFALSFSVPTNAIALDSEAYRLWLTPGEHRFFLIERQFPGEP